MSFKQALKAKLPFTRRGLEDYLDEKLALMQRQQADNIQDQIEGLIAKLAQEMNAQLDRRINDLQSAVIAQLTEELNAQLHRRINDLDSAITFQTEALTAQFAQEINAQLDRRTNDLQSAVIAQLTEELNAQLHRRVNDLDSAITFQTEALTAQFAQEINAQLDRRTNDLQSAVIAQLTEELNAQLHRRVNDLDSAITFQTEALTAQFAQEMNVQLHRRINDLQGAVEVQTRTQTENLFGCLKEEMNLQFHRRTNDLDKAITSVRNELYGFFRRFPKTMLSFEVALAEHCNLNCVGCSHFSPLAPPSFISLEEFTNDFKRMACLFGGRTQQVKLLGGEPLLNQEINKYLVVARECFPNAEIQIITNGLLLPQMNEAFWESCKQNRIVIAPTKYPVKFDYDAAERLANDHDVEYCYFADREVTKVFGKYPLDLKGLQDGEGNYRMCFVANSCIYLQHGHLYTCPIAPTAHYLNEAFGTQLLESPYDSIDIYQAESAEEILEFLAKPIPFCRYCRRDIVIDDIPWSQSKRELSEWTL